METIAFAYCFKLFHASSFSAKPKAGVAKSLISLLFIPSNCGFWKTTETTGTTSLKWQPAFRLVKVVFVVVLRQHRVQNQTVVPVVCVVVKTKAQKIHTFGTCRIFTFVNCFRGCGNYSAIRHTAALRA